MHMGDVSECQEETRLSKSKPLAGCGSGCRQADRCPCWPMTEQVIWRDEFWQHELLSSRTVGHGGQAAAGGASAETWAGRLEMLHGKW